MEYIFSENNRELYEMEKEWIAGNCFGAYMLTGKSGCGKTTFLRQLDADWKEQKNEEMITWFSTEQIIDLILDSIVQDRDFLREVKTSVIVIENMEDLEGKENTLRFLFDRVGKWLKAGHHLFIGTSNGRNLQMPEYVTKLECNEIKVTPQIVYQIACNKDLYIGDERCEEICATAQGKMLRIHSLLQMERQICQ